MFNLKEKLIVALDVDTLEKAEKIVGLLEGKVKYYKIGSQLFTAYGPKAVEMAAKKGGKVFLDLKFHDIPNTVYLSVSAATGLRNVVMMTVHTKGGEKMLREAARAANEKAQELKIPKPYIVGVTRLTSDADNGGIEHAVLEAARLAKDCGLDGVVCAATETKMVRDAFGRDFIIVNPGIRAKTAKLDDQKRVATAKEAIEAGASFIVVGRPVLEAADPLRAVEELLS